jgi:hypothetical protein
MLRLNSGMIAGLVLVLACALGASATDLVVPTDYATIQAAWDAAGDGDTIKVEWSYTDTYADNLVLDGIANGIQNITIKSVDDLDHNVDKEGATIECLVDGMQIQFTGIAQSVTVKGMYATNFGWYASGEATAMFDSCSAVNTTGGVRGFYCLTMGTLVIVGCEVYNSSNTGIYCRDIPGNVTIANCIVDGTGGSGIMKGADSPDGVEILDAISAHVTIANCEVSNTGGQGIACIGADEAQCAGCTVLNAGDNGWQSWRVPVVSVLGCDVDWTGVATTYGGGVTIYGDNGPPDVPCENPVLSINIAGCTLTNTGADAIGCWNVSGPVTITGCTMDTIGTGDHGGNGPEGWGINVFECRGCWPTLVTLTDCDVMYTMGAAPGIQINHADEVRMTNCDVTDTTYGPMYKYTGIGIQVMSTPIVSFTDCDVDTTCAWGEGIAAWNDIGPIESIVFDNCTATNIIGDGLACWCVWGNATFRGCSVDWCDGCGISKFDWVGQADLVTVTDCYVTDSLGPGINVGLASEVLIENCTSLFAGDAGFLVSNTALTTLRNCYTEEDGSCGFLVNHSVLAEIDHCAAVYCGRGGAENIVLESGDDGMPDPYGPAGLRAVVTNCTTDGNWGDGGLWVAGYHRDPGTNGPEDPGFDAYTECVVRDSIISNNTVAAENYGIWLYENCDVTVSYSDYYNNVGGGDYVILDPLTCTYTEGDGVIHADPLFDTDYSLLAGSPCIGAGDPRDLDVLETRADMGFVDYADDPYPAKLMRETTRARLWEFEMPALGHSEFGIPFTPTGSANPNDMITKNGQPFNVNNRVYMWDSVKKTFLLFPLDFTTLDVGQGYLYLNYFGARADQLDIEYAAVPVPVVGQVAIPEEGRSMIAIPNGQPLWMGNILVKNNGTLEIRSALDDRQAADSWLNWNWVYWSFAGSTYDIVGPPTPAQLPSEYVKPWYSYQLWAYQRDLTLIFPGG